MHGETGSCAIRECRLANVAFGFFCRGTFRFLRLEESLGAQRRAKKHIVDGFTKDFCHGTFAMVPLSWYLCHGSSRATARASLIQGHFLRLGSWMHRNAHPTTTASEAWNLTQPRSKVQRRTVLRPTWNRDADQAAD